MNGEDIPGKSLLDCSPKNLKGGRPMLKRALILCFACTVAVSTGAWGTARVEFRLAEDSPAEGLTEMFTVDDGRPVYVYDRVELSDTDISDVGAERGHDRALIVVALTDAGARKLSSVTRENVGKLLCVLVEGEVFAAPKIMQQVSDKEVPLSGWWYTEKEAKRVADLMMGREVSELDIGEVIDDLNGGRWQEVYVAAHHLGRDELRCQKGVEALIAALGERHGLALSRIKKSLANYGPLLLPGLREALTREDSHFQADVLDFISEMGHDAEALTPDIIALLDHPTPHVRSSAAQALVQVSTEREEVVRHLARLLEAFGPDDKVIDAVASLGPDAGPAVPTMIKHLRASGGLQDPYRESVEAASYAIAFKRIGPPAEAAVPDLVKWVGRLPGDVDSEDCDAAEREAPTNASEAMNDPTFRLCFAQAFRKSCAAGALGTIHSQPDICVPALMEAMTQDHYIRRQTALALAEFGKEAHEAVPYLEAIHGNADGDLRVATAVALRCAGGDCSPYVQELTELLGDVEWNIKAFAARELGKLGPAAASALPRLRELQSDKDRVVREAADRAIADIAGD
jgi:hypothetical protein